MSSKDEVFTTPGFSDDYDDDEPFSINAIIPTLGPYTISWADHASLLWSKDLIERGKFRASDALLLAFTVDVAMKLYIVGGIEHPVLHVFDDSGLVWTILNLVRNTLFTQVRLYGWGKGDVLASVELFFLTAATAFPSIRERFEIAFLQKIQDPCFKQMFAGELLCMHSSDKKYTMLRNVFRWVYGEWPQWIATMKTEDAEQFHQRPPISIRQWVFCHN